MNLLLDMLAPPGDAASRRDRVFGAVVGLVTSVDDPDGLGRVKLQFPWLKSDVESGWARIVSFMAGPERGALFRPEVSDEVLVVFEHGDMRFPFVLGGLWNGKDGLPPDRGSDADNDVRLIRSRSGHTIVLDDSPGKEKVTIKDKHGNFVELSDGGIVIKADSIKIGDQASEALVLGDAFLQLFNSHTHGTGVGPSSPPTEPMVKGQHISTKHKAQ